MSASDTAEEPPRRPPSAYQLISDEQIASIHDVSDALFNIIDRNGDESITKEELGAHLLLGRYTEEAIASMFDLLDVNNDGSVSRVELREAFVRYPPLRNAPAMGTLSKSKRADVHAEADATFSALDLNQDGHISLEELQQHFATAEGPSYSEAAVAKIFQTLDADSNGAVSRSEFRGAFVRYRALRLALGLRRSPDAPPDAAA